MRIIHCTQRLLKGIGISPNVDAPANTKGLGNWYANLVEIDGKKCLLFTNEKTLYSFLIPNVKKANLKNIVNEFLINLSYNLQAEGFSLDVITRVMQEYKEIEFTKTASKKMLGSMNQLAFEYEVLVQGKEGLENVKILEINRHINRTILKGIKLLHPIEALREIITRDF